MTLAEFIAGKENDIKEFAVFWNKAEIEELDDIINEMEPDDWEERFETFVWNFLPDLKRCK